jgi:hypothetical protein
VTDPQPQTEQQTGTQQPHRSGLASVVDDDFSVYEAIGGVRGAIESVLPGLAFVVAFVITRNLGLTIIVSGAIALVSVIVRLISRQQVRSALTGVLSILVCLVWAWFSKDAKNFYLPGFLTNAVWIVILAVSLAVRIPGIGVVVEFIRTPVTSEFRKWLAAWRSDARLVHAYVITTWVWIAMFAARLLVQLPLYLANSVGFLGTARLVMGVPLFALTIWVTWVVVSPQVRRTDAEKTAAETEKTEKTAKTEKSEDEEAQND